MADASVSFTRGSTPIAEGDPELTPAADGPRRVDATAVDGEKPKGSERTYPDCRARVQVRKVGPPTSPRSGFKDGLDDEGTIQTIRVSNAASSHWLAIDDDCAVSTSSPPATLYDGTSPPTVNLCCPLLEEQTGGPGKTYKVAGAGGQDGESLQGPHTWRKRLKPISCLEYGEVKREPRRELEHVQERCLKDRRLLRDDHADEAKARSDKIRISPSAKKESTVRAKGQLGSKSILAASHQSPNFVMSKGGRRGSKSQFDSESAFTRQVVKPMKSSVVQRNRSLYPSSYVASKNLSPTFAFSNKKPSSNLEAFGGSGQVTTKMVEKVMKARLYLLQQTGPNSFLIGGDSPDHKYRVIIGPQKCSCGRESLCIHLLFVMLRVFQVPENDPILSRRPLRNYEVEALFRNYHVRRTLRLKDNTKKKVEAKAYDRPSSSVEGEEEDDEDDDVESIATIGQDDDGIEKEEEEVCSICLLEMVEGESLTECKTGCQNRLHHHCIAVWFEECRRQKEALMCPLCRAEWKNEEGESAPVPVSASGVTALPLPPATRESSPHITAACDVDATPIEALPPEHKEIAEKWIPVLGEDIVVRLFSKNWGVREAALRLLSQEAVRVLLLGVGEGRSGVLVSAERQANNHTMLECCCSVLAFSLSDPVYKVFISALRALRMILSYTPCRDELQQSRLQMLMKPVVKSLLLKCADSNRRTSQLSISALEELVKGENGELAVGREIVNPGNLGLGGIGYLIECIVEIDAVENLHWQWILGRFCMLERLLEEYCHEFTVTLSSLPPESKTPPSSDWVASSTNYGRAFSVLRFCTLHMSFGHIKVSKMARRVFYCIARLQLQQGLVFERVFSLLEDVDLAIQCHMKRKLYALMEDYRVVPNGKPEPSVPGGTSSPQLSGAGPLPLPATTCVVPNGALPQVSVTASSPVTDVVTLIVSSVASASGVGAVADVSLMDEVDAPQPVGSTARRAAPLPPEMLAPLPSVVQDGAKVCVAEIPRPQVEYVDACVSTSPLPVQNGDIWIPQMVIEHQAQEAGASKALVSHTDNVPVPNSAAVKLLNNADEISPSVPVVAKLSEAAVVSRPDKIAMSLKGNALITMNQSVGSKESLCDSPPILSARLDAAFGSNQVGLLTEDLSDLILSPTSRPEEKVSFKTEVATTPHGSPQRSADNTADDGCHCKEEVEKEEAEALVEALERSDLPQDALPHVPGLSRGKSDTTLTIHMQDQNASIADMDGFDSRQYQEGVHWKRGSVLGTGAFCTCYHARDNRTGTLMAVKQISICRNTLLEQEKVVNAVKEEIHILGRLSHPNIIRILGATQQGCHFFMFVEWMPGCSVATLLDRYGQFSEQVITSYTLQVLRGLAYLHDNQVVHRDLKGANLLVDSTGHRVRIGDFGAAARLATQVTVNGQFEGQLIGTIAFMAPEVLRGDTYGRKCDIWSFGCTMVEMATALPPWGANDISNHLALIFKIASTVRPPPIPENLSPPIRDVMLRCLEVNPEDRPLAKDLLKHPMFRN